MSFASSETAGAWKKRFAMIRATKKPASTTSACWKNASW
jgi:hypothetical protein